MGCQVSFTAGKADATNRAVDEPSVVCLVKHVREAAGLSQAALAARVGVSRQTLSALEGGRQVPSTALALLLARALGCGVDELFQLAPGGHMAVALAPVGHASARAGRARLAVGWIDGRWVAHRLADDAPAAADAILAGDFVQADENDVARALVEPLVEPAELRRHLLVAGCAPLLAPLAQRVGARYRDARVSWLSASSGDALSLLGRGLVHVAGLHLAGAGADPGDAGAGDNLDEVRARFPGRRMLVVHLTRWRQGLLVAPGNPLGVRTAGDLLRPRLRFARREAGAGASALVHRLLGAEACSAHLQAGPLAADHADVARLVQRGSADVGVAIESAALAAGLDFVPLAEERFDLVLPAERAALTPVARLLDALGGAAFRAEAAGLPGYDSARSGEVVTVDAA